MKKTVTAALVAASLLTSPPWFCKAMPVSRLPEPNQLIQSIAFSSADGESMHKAELFGYTVGFPRVKVLTIDGTVVGRNPYERGQMMIGDVTDDREPEVFFYQYGIGSSGAMGLSIYSLFEGGWRPIFAEPSRSSIVGADERFVAAFIGGGKLKFYDSQTALTGVVDLSHGPFSNAELKTMVLHTDPVSAIVIQHENFGFAIETVQSVWAVSHPNTVFTIHNCFRYKPVQHAFTFDAAKILDNRGTVLASRSYLPRNAGK